jgi:hypothetical protein
LSSSKDNCILETFPNELITSVPWGDLFNIGQDLEVADIYPGVHSSAAAASRVVMPPVISQYSPICYPQSPAASPIS